MGGGRGRERERIGNGGGGEEKALIRNDRLFQEYYNMLGRAIFKDVVSDI